MFLDEFKDIYNYFESKEDADRLIALSKKQYSISVEANNIIDLYNKNNSKIKVKSVQLPLDIIDIEPNKAIYVVFETLNTSDIELQAEVCQKLYKVLKIEDISIFSYIDQFTAIDYIHILY